MAGDKLASTAMSTVFGVHRFVALSFGVMLYAFPEELNDAMAPNKVMMRPAPRPRLGKQRIGFGTHAKDLRVFFNPKPTITPALTLTLLCFPCPSTPSSPYFQGDDV